MVVYRCEKCNKIFKQKGHYLTHINKKFSCTSIIVTPQIPTIPHINPLILQNSQFINPNLIIQGTKNNVENLNNSCEYCGIIISRKDHLKRHMDKYCKVRKLQNEEKENIFKILLAKDEENKREMLKKDEEIKKKDEENKKHITKLEDYIKKLTDMNLDLNNKVTKLIEKVSVQNINKGVINNNNNNINTNIIIGTDKLCNFGSEDLQIINPSLFNNLFGKYGKEVFLECVKNIYNNESKNKTLYISDLSREKCMAWENNNWNLISWQKAVNTVEAQIRKYFKHNEKYYEEKLKDKKIKEKYDNQVKKWYKMYYDEYDEDDKYEPPESRLQEFHRVVNNGLQDFFYNIREDIKTNHDKIKNKLMDDTLLKQINYEPPKKGRGRPKKAETIANQIQNDQEIKNNINIKVTKSTDKNKLKSTKIESNNSEDIKEFIMNLMNKESLDTKSNVNPKFNSKSKVESDSDELVPIGKPRSQKSIDRENEAKLKSKEQIETTKEFTIDPNLRPVKFTAKSFFDLDSDSDSDNSNLVKKSKKKKNDKKKTKY